MRLVAVVVLLACASSGAYCQRRPTGSIKWKCLDAFNKFRSDAARGQLNSVNHAMASKTLAKAEHSRGSKVLKENSEENSRNLLKNSMGPMANVKKLIWDEKLVKSANESAHKCPESGGRRGEKYREFSLYYTPDKQYKHIGEMITKNLKEMTPWMKGVMPPTPNDTMYFYVAGEFFWATREYIGCVNAYCGNRALLECHMSPGNILEGVPFIEGPPCSKCDKGYVCVEYLCAREGRIKPKSEASKSTSRSFMPIPIFSFVIIALFV